MGDGSGTAAIILLSFIPTLPDFWMAFLPKWLRYKRDPTSVVN